MDSHPLTVIAARNNAEWCDALCRTHGLVPAFAGYAWTCATRTPPLYPDAVTLSRDADVGALLARIDPAPGCTIKDSFATLDLAPHGFEVLFDATWQVRSSGQDEVAADANSWTVVTTVSALRAWHDAWRGPDDPSDLFRPALLEHPDVTILSAHHAATGDIVAGLIANRSEHAIGVTNLFDRDGALTSAAWSHACQLLDRRWPGCRLVGYGLDDVVAHDVERIGPLRVWIRRAS